MVHAPGPPATRVPSPLTSFVGRDEDIARVLKNLRAARLVTLTGPGGVGKTRLAAEASGRLDVAAWFVPLAPVTDPAEVASRSRRARRPRAGHRPACRRPGRDPLERLAAALADRDDVLILDNCEHVIEAAAALAGPVLAACPRMRILATSRQPLRIDGETLCPVSAAAGPARPAGTGGAAVPRRWRPTGRPGCSGTGPRRSGPTSSSTRPTRPRWPGSAGRSTACRSPSNWPRCGCAR